MRGSKVVLALAILCAWSNAEARNFQKGPSTRADCKCGQLNTASRIVGGSTTTVNEIPYHVSILFPFSQTPVCQGFIVSEDHVVTSAHCFDGLPTTSVSMRVGVGIHDFLNPTTSTVYKYINIASVTKHPGYNRNATGFNDDVAVVTLAEKITFGTDNKIAPVCLPAANSACPSGSEALVAGWGDTTYDRAMSNVLLKVTVNIIDNADCNAQIGSDAVTSNMICAGVNSGGRDSCQRDNGAALLCKTAAGHYEAVGLVSFGRGCAIPGVPGVYTRISSYADWIRGITQSSSTCSP